MQSPRSLLCTFAVLAVMVAGAAPGGRSAVAAETDLLGDKPVLHVATFDQAPTIDGRPDEPVWAAAQVAGPFWHFLEGVPAANDTWAKMDLDAEHIYVAFGCRETEMARLKVEPLPPDSMDLYANDHIEFFFMPDAMGGPFYHFSVDVAGNRHDELGGDGSWNCEWEAAVARGEDVWTVELRIPRAAVGLSDPRMSLANFCRTRRLEPGETSAWAKTFGVFHNPARFGRLVYTPAGGVEIAAVALRHPSIGQNLIGITLRGGREAAEVTVEGFVGEGDAASRFGRQSVRVTADTEVTVDFPLEVESDARTTVTLTAGEAGRVESFCNVSEVSLSGARPLPIRGVLGPEAAPFLQWIDTERLRGISYGVAFGAPVPEDGLVLTEPPVPTGDVLRLRGQAIFRIEMEAGAEIVFDLDALPGDSAFTDSIYALFDPAGALLSKGVVAAGETGQVRVPAPAAGRYTLLVNSGPASWNPFSIIIRNPHWALDARGRSTYLSSPLSLHTLRDSRLAGMNLALMAAWQWGIPFADDEGLARWRERLEQMCAAAQEADIKLIPYVGWGCAETECAAAGDYTRALTRLSVRGPHPCPISREYWERSFLRRALVIAELSREYPNVIGVGLDPESYYFGGWYAKNLTDAGERARSGAIYQPYGSSREKCACDRCFGGFLASRGLATPDVPEDGNARFDWIAEQGLLDDFCAYQQDELEALLGEVRERVHAVNPDLCFAVLLLSIGDNWFCRGMARGLGTPRTPALDFDEGTYTSGYSSAAVRRKLEQYENWDAHVVHGGTLWAVKHPPADRRFLSAQMFNFALYGHGCWFWPGSMSVWRSSNEVAGYFSLSGYTEDYWKAIVEANREIDKRIADPDGHRSPLEQIRQRPAIPREPAPGEKNEWAQKPSYPVHVYAATRLSFSVPPGAKGLGVCWGYREDLGERTLVVNLGGQEHRLTATVEADRENRADLQVPAAGCTGWLELQPRAGEGEQCLGLRLEGAKQFFGGGGGMGLK